MSNYFQISNQYKKSYTAQQDWKRDGEGPDGEYIQLWPYFQLINFRLVDDSGEEHSFNVYAE